MWTMVLIFLITFGFGIFLTQVVTDHKLALEEEEVEKQEALEEFYGTLVRSMFFLYQAISDGVHWGELAEPLVKDVSPWAAFAFIVYTAFVIFAMMNVVTAFFVESALKSAQGEEKQ